MKIVKDFNVMNWIDHEIKILVTETQYMVCPNPSACTEENWLLRMKTETKYVCNYVYVS